MAFIKYLPQEDVPEDCRVPDTDNILRVHSIHGRVMQLHFDLYKEVMHGASPLTRVQREMVAVAVSAINGCHYWVHHHSRGLRELLAKDDVAADESGVLIDCLKTNAETAKVNASDRALLNYAVKLTREPASVSVKDVQQLRSHGFDDLAIHDLASVVSYFAFVNRIADGLGVELESE